MDLAHGHPESPTTGLQALANLEMHAMRVEGKVRKRAKGFRRLLGLLRIMGRKGLPERIDGLTTNMRFFVGWSAQNAQAFYDTGGEPLEAWRMERILEKLVNTLMRLSYLVEGRARSSSKSTTRMQMKASTEELAEAIYQLGGVVQPYISREKLSRISHAVTRFRRAAEAWEDDPDQ